MRHRQQERRPLNVSDVLPFLIGAIAIVAIPLAIFPVLLRGAITEEKGAPLSTMVSIPAETSETHEPPPADVVEHPPTEEAVSRYAEIEISEEDTYILACLVYHEARGEPFEGQVAVVEVVFNRCLSDDFPDTIEEVVFQKYGDVWQFSPVPYLYTAEPSEVQYNAVMYAYNTEEHVVPPETVFFSTSPYNEQIVAVIGNHYFCGMAARFVTT